MSKQLLEALSDGEARSASELSSITGMREDAIINALKSLSVSGQATYAGASYGEHTWRANAGSGRNVMLDSLTDSVGDSILSPNIPSDDSFAALIDCDESVFIDALGWPARATCSADRYSGPPVESAIRWLGGKTDMLSRLNLWMPEHHAYVEVFGGSLKPFFSKKPSRYEVVNDAYGMLIDFWREAMDQPERLAEAVNSYPDSRLLHRIMQRKQSRLTRFERAVRFGYLVRTSFNGMPWSSYGSNPAKTPARLDKDAVEACAKRLAGVIIECQSFDDIVERYNKRLGQLGKVYFYMDPPYYGTAGYAVDFPESSHRKLADCMQAIADSDNLVLMTNSDKAYDLYKGYLKDPRWVFSKVAVRYNVGAGVGAADFTTETVVSNFALKRETLARSSQASLF